MKTFRKQVHYARRFVDADESLEKDVPNTELAKFFDVVRSETIRAILNTTDVDYEYLGKPSILSDDDFKDIAGWVKQAALNQKPMTINVIVDLSQDNNIELVYFMPNNTHVFQPLDLPFFSAFKERRM